jgi:hypothetical protein
MFAGDLTDLVTPFLVTFRHSAHPDSYKGKTIYIY